VLLVTFFPPRRDLLSFPPRSGEKIPLSVKHPPSLEKKRKIAFERKALPLF